MERREDCGTILDHIYNAGALCPYYVEVEVDVITMLRVSGCELRVENFSVERETRSAQDESGIVTI